MISELQLDGFPKYVWAVDADGQAYEAKLGPGGQEYHGYVLGDDDAAMRQTVLREWQRRDVP